MRMRGGRGARTAGSRRGRGFRGSTRVRGERREGEERARHLGAAVASVVDAGVGRCLSLPCLTHGPERGSFVRSRSLATAAALPSSPRDGAAPHEETALRGGGGSLGRRARALPFSKRRACERCSWGGAAARGSGSHLQKTQSLSMDILASATMKNAAKCDT